MAKYCRSENSFYYSVYSEYTKFGACKALFNSSLQE